MPMGLKHFGRLIIAGAGLVGMATAEAGRPALCYLPGAGGGSPFTKDELPPVLQRRGVEFVFFDVGNRGRVEDRAQAFVRGFEARLAKDPGFRCHLVAFSMGGVVTRYAFAHKLLHHPRARRPTSWGQHVLTITTLATPHRGTPLPRLILQRARNLLQLDPGEIQMSEDNIGVFNDPASELYSPEPRGLPVSSVRLWVPRDTEAGSFFKRLTFRWIFADLQQRGLSPLNDTVVPLESQNFGRAVATLRLPHAYFSKDRGASPTPADFYELLWRNAERPFANGELERHLSAGIRPLANLPYERNFDELDQIDEARREDALL